MKLFTEKTQENFKPYVPLVVYWDGKMMSDIDESENVERLSVLVTGCGIQKLLGVPNLLDSKGEAIVTAVVNSLQEWEILLKNFVACRLISQLPKLTTSQRLQHQEPFIMLVEWPYLFITSKCSYSGMNF